MLYLVLIKCFILVVVVVVVLVVLVVVVVAFNLLCVSISTFQGRRSNESSIYINTALY